MVKILRYTGYSGVVTQKNILATIEFLGGKANDQEIAEELNVGLTFVSRITTALVKNGSVKENGSRWVIVKTAKKSKNDKKK